MNRLILYFQCITCLTFTGCQPAKEKTSPGNKAVEVRFQDGRYLIYRFGKPYYIKGVGITDSRNLRKLVETGGNSVRLYGTYNAKNVLDSAQSLGLTVMLGLDLIPSGPNMDYNDESALNEQFERIRKEVIKFRKCPSLLMWSIGNEVGLNMTPGNFLTERQIWIHIDKISRMIHELDPDHPTTTAIERPGKLFYVEAYCRNLDLISINSFKPLSTVQKNMKEYGWNKPYIISEYGSTGYWFMDHTDWYTYREETSQEKMKFMVEQYRSIKSDSNYCLGSYAFLWGQKNECTPTYFSLFTENGKETEMIDGLNYSWTGKWPAIRSPSIFSLFLNNQKSSENIYLEPGEQFTTRIIYTGLQKNTVLHWRIDRDDDELYFDPTVNQEKRKKISEDSIILQDRHKPGTPLVSGSHFQYSFTIRAPKESGPYRLFLFLENENKVSTANACFYVHD